MNGVDFVAVRLEKKRSRLVHKWKLVKVCVIAIAKFDVSEVRPRI